MKAGYNIIPAPVGFKCGICGTKVMQGENCVEQDGSLTCACVLPARKLIATGIIRPLQGNGETFTKLRIENLRLRMDLEVLTSYPDGQAAKKLISKYRRERKKREEGILSIKN